MLLSTYHIGILDFTLFEDHPKFMAKYQILDVEDGIEQGIELEDEVEKLRTMLAK